MKIDIRDVYEQIGNALYAVAADQHIKPLEVAELKLLISMDWLPRNSDSGEAASNEAHCIILTMDALQANSISSVEAFKDFEKFFGLHREVFTDELRQRIVETSGRIVKIFSGSGDIPNVHFEAVKELLQVAPLQDSVG